MVNKSNIELAHIITEKVDNSKEFIKFYNDNVVLTGQ